MVVIALMGLIAIAGYPVEGPILYTPGWVELNSASTGSLHESFR